MDRKEVAQRVFKNILGHPIGLIPLLIGMTLLIIGWGASSLATSLIGGLTCLGAVALAGTRGYICTEDITKKVIDEISAEEQEALERALDQLEESLAQDEDPRDEELLRDLRELTRTFKNSSWSGSMTSSTAFNAATAVDSLFRKCVQLLQEALEVQIQQKDFQSAAAKKPLRARRESLLGEVLESVTQMSDVLTRLQEMAAAQDTGDASRERSELIQSLHVAERTMQRMDEISSALAPKRKNRE